MSSSHQAIVIAGEASETDEEDDHNEQQFSISIKDNDDDEHIVADGDSLRQHRNESSKTQNSCSEWNAMNLTNRAWSMHVDEKLENRWRLLAADANSFANRQCVPLKKQMEILRSATTNTQHIVQEVSFNLRRASENLAHLEANISLLLEGAKFVPDLVMLPNNN
ncbi:unnamed protein product [Anisakis simplex]|uniref:Biogenesis of lysosome-related organelles complex 1 subunit 3 n=1 Tax=Anisakis simplex TaxID=6269 RepID=A0A0M3JTW8_ANISI|nr:unnamed protein product [Anisakis simplex]